MQPWIKTEIELPSVIKEFSDGTRYHGVVIGWFDQFARVNARETALWTSDNTEPRWMVQLGEGLGPAVAPPTHWTPRLERPHDMSHVPTSAKIWKARFAEDIGPPEDRETTKITNPDLKCIQHGHQGYPCPYCEALKEALTEQDTDQ